MKRCASKRMFEDNQQRCSFLSSRMFFFSVFPKKTEIKPTVQSRIPPILEQRVLPTSTNGPAGSAEMWRKVCFQATVLEQFGHFWTEYLNNQFRPIRAVKRRTVLFLKQSAILTTKTATTNNRTTTMTTTSPQLLFEPTPSASFSNPHKEHVNALVELNDGSFVSCSFDNTAKRWVWTTTTTTTFSLLALTKDTNSPFCVRWKKTTTPFLTGDSNDRHSKSLEHYHLRVSCHSSDGLFGLSSVENERQDSFCLWVGSWNS